MQQHETVLDIKDNYGMMELNNPLIDSQTNLIVKMRIDQGVVS